MRGRYKVAVEWIAMNDAAGDKAPAEELAGYISVILVADVFEKEPIDVANDVITVRARLFPATPSN